MLNVQLVTEEKVAAMREKWARWVDSNSDGLADAEYESVSGDYFEYSSDGIRVAVRQTASDVWHASLYDLEENVFYYGPLFFDEDLEIYFPKNKVTMFFDASNVHTGTRLED